MNDEKGSADDFLTGKAGFDWLLERESSW